MEKPSHDDPMDSIGAPEGRADDKEPRTRTRDGFSGTERALMRRALALARRAVGNTYPNPAVGAVLVRDGRILGEGYHRRAGLAHAEVEALADCRARGNDARGATLFVTLEPCNHHGRTPPCTEAILEAGIARVLVGARDPNRATKGRGVERLRANGIRVNCGLLGREARDLNEGFHFFHETGRPMITLKWAMSLDGCTAARTGEAFWITGESARRDAHRLRARHGCIAVGIGTVLRDDPQLTVRLPGKLERQPDRLIVDSRLRIPPTARVLGDAPEQVVVATLESSDTPKAQRLKDLGIRLITLAPAIRERDGGCDDGVPVGDLVERLGTLGMQSIFVEGGRRLAGSFLAARRIDRVVAYFAPLLIGSGEAALGPLVGGAAIRPSDGVRLSEVKVGRCGEDFRVVGRPVWPL